MPNSPYDRRPSSDLRSEVNRRARLFVGAAVEQTYQSDLVRWARDDDAPFPDRQAIRSQIEAELLLLCSGLGSWAAAEPGEFFNPIDHRIRRAERDGWEW